MIWGLLGQGIGDLDLGLTIFRNFLLRGMEKRDIADRTPCLVTTIVRTTHFTVLNTILEHKAHDLHITLQILPQQVFSEPLLIEHTPLLHSSIPVLHRV